MGLLSKKIDQRIAAYQRELIETHYAEVDNMYRQIRGWRHDYRNHIQTMKAYAATENWGALRDYLNLLETDLNTVDTVIKTGNAMTDAILNSKINLARAKDITVQADAHIPVKLKLSELDLCCIIGNLFDNAIEASLSLPEDQRLIRVYMDTLTPAQVTYASGRKVWWKCPKGHSWKAPVYSRQAGNGCPYCSRHKHGLILCEETGKTYQRYEDVALDLGISIASVSLVVNGKQQSVKGYHLKFLDE